MPKTAVDEHGDLQPWEGDVGASSDSWQNGIINRIAEAFRVQGPSETDLGSRIP
jgi:hypothetical protein